MEQSGGGVELSCNLAVSRVHFSQARRFDISEKILRTSSICLEGFDIFTSPGVTSGHWVVGEVKRAGLQHSYYYSLSLSMLIYCVYAKRHRVLADVKWK